MMIQLLNQIPDTQKADLFNDSSWHAVRELAQCLPPLSGGGFEVHLNANVPRTDLMFRATSTDHGREVLAGVHTQWNFPDVWLQRESWQKIQRFARHWAEPENPMYRAIENVWLEFDIIPGKCTVIDPSIFFDLDRHRGLSNDSRRSALNCALTSFNHELPDGILQTLQVISDKIPNGGHLYYVGLMLSRPERSIRVCLAGLGAEDIQLFLKSIDCDEHAHNMQIVLANCVQSPDKLVLHLDIGSVVGPKIGIEIFPSENTWPDLFARMRVAGYCSSEEAHKILGFAGALPLEKDSFQESLSKTVNRNVTSFIRRINHVKFVSNKNGTSSVKAYLYYGYN